MDHGQRQPSLRSGFLGLLRLSWCLALLCPSAPGQVPCGATSYGSGTPGSGGTTPLLSISDLPLLGNPAFGLHSESLLGGAWAAHMLSANSTSRTVLGIELLVENPLVLAGRATGTGAGNGTLRLALPIPADPALVDAELYAQVASLDPAGPSGVAASDGLRVTVRANNLLGATAAHQGAAGSDAYSAIHHLGDGRIIAGRRSSSASNRFLLSEDGGTTWRVVGCPGSTGAHTYFFGQKGARVFAGTGDTGNACLMVSDDTGKTWRLALDTVRLRQLVGSRSALSVFSVVHVGDGRWLANVKTFDSRVSVIVSNDHGNTWSAAAAQPGSSPTSWARQMIRTADDVLLWPEVLTNQMYRSTDRGRSWNPVPVPGASLFQPLCDAGDGIYLCGDATANANTSIGLHRSLDRGLTWSRVTSVNLGRSTPTYWRDVVRAGDALYASACCHEGTSHERFMQLFRSVDVGATWCSLGNPYQGPFGGMQAIYQMCVTPGNVVFAGCQPDRTILRWTVPPGGA